MTNTSEKYLVGVYDDEEVLLSAISQVRRSGVKIHEVFTPFPIHGLDEALGYRRTRLPIAAFLFGMTGTATAITMISWMLGFDWPMNIGGKNHLPPPDYVPVTFELTVLFAALGLVFTFLLSNDIGPGKQAKIFDLRSTDDKFIMAVNVAKNKLAPNEIETILRDNGATEVNVKQFD
ncbi:MAG: DUF3341 domain-containing protein [Bacteroidota bacterium]